jgi:hypothetical protein
MTYRGKVKAGAVILDSPLALPDGTEVNIAPIEPTDSTLTWGEVFRDEIGTAKGLPDDFAENHDHYIHGSPKR